MNRMKLFMVSFRFGLVWFGSTSIIHSMEPLTNSNGLLFFFIRNNWPYVYRARSPNSYFTNQKWEWASNRKSLMAKTMCHYGRRMCSANKMFVLSDIKHTWDYHWNKSPFANPGSGSFIIIVVWYLLNYYVYILGRWRNEHWRQW